MSRGAFSEPLERKQALALLGGARLGRLVLSIDCLPAARLVPIALIDEMVVAGVPPGPEMETALRGDVVTIQTDGHEDGGSTLWTVSVTGIARPVEQCAIERPEQLAVRIRRVAELGGRVIGVGTSVMHAAHFSELLD
jgi:hypothetical protein